MMVSSVPDELRGSPFTTAQARAVGVTPGQLRGPNYRSLHPGHGVWCVVDEARTLKVLLAADQLILPRDAAVSHVTGLRLHGIEVGGTSKRHWSTNTPAQRRSPDLIVHRRQALLHAESVGGIRVLGPDRCLVDAAISLSLREIVRIGDALIRSDRTSPDVFAEFAWSRHLHGVARSRMSAWRMRERVDSFSESDVRLIMEAAGLPQPEVNGPIAVDQPERRNYHGDLVLRRWKLVIEYDGWHHERSASQRQIDILRREALEAAGWLVIVLTANDVAQPATLVGRVWRALAFRGHPGPPPRFDRATLHELWRSPKAWDLQA